MEAPASDATTMSPEEAEITKKFWHGIQAKDAQLQRKNKVVTIAAMVCAMCILASVIVWLFKALLLRPSHGKEETFQ